MGSARQEGRHRRLGGLGHMGVKLALLRRHVVVLTTSPRKAADALRLGAHSDPLDRCRRHEGARRASTSSSTRSRQITTSTNT
jgi:hypothetical protein